MLEARNISVGYGICDVIRETSFVVREGEITVILGANGAGKTTLLRSLNGAIPIVRGEIWLSDKPLKKHSRREIANQIAVVAQENETKFPITVLEFVLSGRFAHHSSLGWETENDLTIARRALREADLKDFERRLMNHLSGGERQRAVFARALATEAKILLLDEPTANLDLQHQASLLRLVREKCDAENLAAVVITHDLNLAAQFADKVLLLKNGAVYTQGTPQEVLTEDIIKTVFAINVVLDQHPATRKPRVTTIY